jgi:hypothetical protein
MNKRSNESGQSTIEFLVSFVFILGFMFLYLKVALNMTNGYLVHYANFMASRAYLTSDNNSNSPEGGDADAEGRAKEVFESLFVNDFVTSTGGTAVAFEINDPNFGGNLIFRGSFATYSDQLSPSSALGGGNTIEFVSESFLGREPTRAECISRICAGFAEVGAAQCNRHVTLMDNGC